MDYTESFFLNVVALPAFLLGLVAAVWATNPEDAETKANKRSDYYFAFFLSCKSHLNMMVDLSPLS